MSFGVIYVATGQRYVNEMAVSVRSLKQHMPDLPVTLFTDPDSAVPHVDVVTHIEPSGDGFRDKIQTLRLSPYERTLFIDTDTYICHDFGDLPLLLDHFDLALAHAPKRALYPMPDVPDSFAELNTGVLLYRQSPEFQTFVDAWLEIYDAHLRENRPEKLNDQPPFRVAIFHSNLRVATLGPEYNCRAAGGGYLIGPVRILHIRAPETDLQRMAHDLNAYTGPRVHAGGRLYIQETVGRLVRRSTARFYRRLAPPTWQVALRRAQTSLHKRGWRGTLLSVWRTIRSR